MSSIRAPIAAALTLASAGCSSDSATLELPSSLVSSAHRTLVVAVEDPNDAEMRLLGLKAFARTDDPFVASFRLSEPIDGARVTILAYEEDAATVGVEPGDVPLIEGGRMIPNADLFFEADVAAGSASPWRMIGALSPSLSRARIEDLTPATPCERAVVTSHPLTVDHSDVYALAVADDGLAYFGGHIETGAMLGTATAGGEFSYIEFPPGYLDIRSLAWDSANTRMLGTTPEGLLFAIDPRAHTITATRAVAPDRELASAPDGTVILYGEDGQASFVRADLALDPWPNFPQGALQLLLRSQTDAVLLTADRIHTWDGAIWTREPVNPRFDRNNAVLASEGRTIAALGLGSIYRKDGAGDWQELSLPIVEAFFAIAVAPSGELIAGGTLGLMYLGDGTDWCRLDSGTVKEIRAFAKPRDGELFGVTLGDGLQERAGFLFLTL